MKIQHAHTQSFGMKIPAKEALQAATARNLFGTDESIRLQKRVISKLTNYDVQSLEHAEFGRAVNKLIVVLREKHPVLDKIATKIDTLCANFYDTLYPVKTQKEFNEDLNYVVTSGLKEIGKEIDIEPVAAKTLGLA